MNKERRKALVSIQSQMNVALNALKDSFDKSKEAFENVRTDIEDFCGALDEAKTAIEDLMNEEQEAFDSMPEGLQQGDRGQACETAISEMETAMDELDEVIEKARAMSEAIDILDEEFNGIDDAVSSLDRAQE